MTEVWRAIETQRAVRVFDPRPLPEETIERIIQAGRLAPSSNNEQRWAFIICTDRAHLQQLSKVGDWAEHLAGAAAAVALVTPEAEQDWETASIAYDLGQASQSMMLAAWDLGVGSVHAAVYDEPMTRELLGYPEGWRCDYLLSFGFPSDPGALTSPRSMSARKPASETVHRERW